MVLGVGMEVAKVTGVRLSKGRLVPITGVPSSKGRSSSCLARFLKSLVGVGICWEGAKGWFVSVGFWMGVGDKGRSVRVGRGSFDFPAPVRRPPHWRFFLKNMVMRWESLIQIMQC